MFQTFKILLGELLEGASFEEGFVPKGNILPCMSTTTIKTLPQWGAPLLGGRRECALGIPITCPRSKNSS